MDYHHLLQMVIEMMNVYLPKDYQLVVEILHLLRYYYA